LPTFYTEDLMDEVDDETRATKDFIDIIHQRLYHLLYQAWLKYRQFQQVSEERDSGHITRLFCLLGLGEPGFREGMDNAEQLLRYLGLFSQSPRSALGLKTVLKDHLNLPVDILPCVQRKAKIPIDQRIQLGSRNAGLGLDSFLGEEMDDRMGKFRIRVGPLDEQRYRAFIPGSELYNRLVFLTGLYVLDPLEYDIDVTMAASQAQTVCLGGSRWASLGHDTWIFSGETLGRTTSRFYPGRQTTN
jgi:type VI secretion system protein ImpH